MKRLLFIPALALLFTPFTGEAITGPAHREDWSLGQPSVVANATENCTDTATARFDWVLGQPAVVIDSTANCTAAGGAAADPKVIIRTQTFIRGQTIIQSQVIIP